MRLLAIVINLQHGTGWRDLTLFTKDQLLHPRFRQVTKRVEGGTVGTDGRTIRGFDHAIVGPSKIVSFHHKVTGVGLTYSVKTECPQDLRARLDMVSGTSRRNRIGLPIDHQGQLCRRVNRLDGEPRGCAVVISVTILRETRS